MDCLGVLFFVFVIVMVVKNNAKGQKRSDGPTTGPLGPLFGGVMGQMTSQTRPINQQARPVTSQPTFNQQARNANSVNTMELFKEEQRITEPKRQAVKQQAVKPEEIKTQEIKMQKTKSQEPTPQVSVIANSTSDMEAWSLSIQAGSELMKQVEDLMITGYNGKLTYERDFVSEGIEMLNRYEL